MSRNVDVVRAVLEAQRQRDWKAFRRLYDPDIEWEDVSGLWGDWGTRRGFEDVRDAFVTWFEAFERVDFDIENIIESGDEVVVFMRIRGRGSGEWSRRRAANPLRVDGARRQDRAGEGLSERGRRPRSRRAAGVVRRSPAVCSNRKPSARSFFRLPCGIRLARARGAYRNRTGVNGFAGCPLRCAQLCGVALRRAESDWGDSVWL
jgi:ketosteroid isomerase-like protein